MAKAKKDDLVGVRLKLPRHIDRRLESECVKRDVTKQAFMQRAITRDLYRATPSSDSTMESSEQ